MSTGIVTAGGGHSWETGVVAEVARFDASITVIRRCADMADVLAVASTGQISAAVVAADLRRLDSESVHELAAFGVVVIGVHRAGDSRAATALQRIGIAESVPDDASPTAIMQTVRSVLARGAARPDAVTGTVVAGSDPIRAFRDESPHIDSKDKPLAVPRPLPDDPADGDADGSRGSDGRRSRRDRRRGHRARNGRAAHAAGPARGIVAALPDVEPREAGTRRTGRTIAVWGPAGAPGRSTVAMGLADRMVAAGSSAVLIDADVYGGVLANAFGLLDESAGLAGACRLASNGRLDLSDFAGLCWQVQDRLTLMTGIARADRWPELRPSAIPHVLDRARELADVVIVDCSSVLETDEEITFDTLAPRRNGATIAVLAAADVVLAVGAADPPGMERLARGFADVSALIEGVEPKVVFNRVRSSAASTAELREASRQFCGCDPVAFLPEDRTLVDVAWKRGVTLSMVTSKSPLINALDRLAAVLVDTPPR